MDKVKKLDTLMKDENTYIAPGVYDGISAKVGEKTGFQILSVTGNGAAASMLGTPDVGLTTMSEVVTVSGNIAECVDVPVIADADTGYGGKLNVYRTIREFEKNGLAGVHIEDQVNPKKCAYYQGERQVVTTDEHVERIKIATLARKNKKFQIIARTDALKSIGLEEAIKRAKKYEEAGADGIFVVGIREEREVQSIKSEINVPLIVNVNDGAPLTQYSLKELNKMGIKLVLYPATISHAAGKAISNVCKELYDNGNTNSCLNDILPRNEFNEILEIDKFIEIEKS